MSRVIWKGAISFGLVNVPVQLHPATRPERTSFNLLDKETADPIGYDLRNVPLVQRRALLRALMENVDDDALRFSEDFALDTDDLLRSACEMVLEGIVGKHRDSHYTSTRSGAWIKLRCRKRQEFVIGGFTEPSGGCSGLGALLLGVHDGLVWGCPCC